MLLSIARSFWSINRGSVSPMRSSIAQLSYETLLRLVPLSCASLQQHVLVLCMYDPGRNRIFSFDLILKQCHVEFWLWVLVVCRPFHLETFDLALLLDLPALHLRAQPIDSAEAAACPLLIIYSSTCEVYFLKPSDYEAMCIYLTLSHRSSRR